MVHYQRFAESLGVVRNNLDAKNFAESAVVKMFGGHVSKMNDIEDFAKLF